MENLVFDDLWSHNHQPQHGVCDDSLDYSGVDYGFIAGAVDFADVLFSPHFQFLHGIRTGGAAAFFDKLDDAPAPELSTTPTVGSIDTGSSAAGCQLPERNQLEATWLPTDATVPVTQTSQPSAVEPSVCCLGEEYPGARPRLGSDDVVSGGDEEDGVSAILSSCENMGNLSSSCNNNASSGDSGGRYSSFFLPSSHHDDACCPGSIRRKRRSGGSSSLHDILRSNSSATSGGGGFNIAFEKPAPASKRPKPETSSRASRIDFRRGSSALEPDAEAVAKVKEMIYRAAAMRPVSLGAEPPARKPKRKNVRVSSDPQTAAARHRRERISERLSALQRLVPGGSKMDTATMLDEAAGYLKFLKSQVAALEEFGRRGAEGNKACAGLPLPLAAQAAHTGYFPMQSHFYKLKP